MQLHNFNSGPSILPQEVLEKAAAAIHNFNNTGLSILEIAHRNNIDLEGACEGSLACSTCHVIVDSEYYSKLTPATEEEEDMLFEGSVIPMFETIADV